MPVKNYYTVNGRIIGEKTVGGSRVDYLSDALGNVTGTVDQSANVINIYRYKPYGELLAKTGSGSDPSFGWIGTLGYRKTSRRFSEQYVRARHYGTSQGQWTTVDPWWPTEPAYLYVMSRPTFFVDPSGFAQITLEFNAFIGKKLPEWIKEPLSWVPNGGPGWGLPGGDWEFHADHRDFGAKGTSRLRSVVKIDSCSIGKAERQNVSVTSTVGESRRRWRRSDGSYRYQRATANLGINYVDVVSDPDTCRTLIIIKAGAGYPFVIGSPAIDYTVYWLLQVPVKDRVRVAVKGWHDKFPFYEAIVSWKQRHILYKYTPTDAGPSMQNLQSFVLFGWNEIGLVGPKTCCCPKNS